LKNVNHSVGKILHAFLYVKEQENTGYHTSDPVKIDTLRHFQYSEILRHLLKYFMTSIKGHLLYGIFYIFCTHGPGWSICDQRPDIFYQGASDSVFWQ
jgi:hypothetical protein